MQKHVNLVDLVKGFPTNIYLQNLASIQKRTRLVKFANLDEKSGKGSISNLSTKSETSPRRSRRFAAASRESDARHSAGQLLSLGFFIRNVEIFRRFSIVQEIRFLRLMRAVATASTAGKSLYHRNDWPLRPFLFPISPTGLLEKRECFPCSSARANCTPTSTREFKPRPGSRFRK